MKQRLITALLLTTISSISYSETTQSRIPLTLTLGAKLHSGGWTGENKGSIGNDIESEKGRGIGLSVGLRKGNFFGVFNVQAGIYEFDDEQPVYNPDPISEDFDLTGSDDLTINTGFVSLGLGYQFNRYFALQGGIKSHSQAWEDLNREVDYIGVGIGATGFIPLSDNWTLYGTLGINGMDIKDKDGNDIGDGSSTSLELGAAFRVSALSSISFGFKNEAVTAEFAGGNEQEHNIANFYFGFNHGFRF